MTRPWYNQACEKHNMSGHSDTKEWEYPFCKIEKDELEALGPPIKFYLENSEA
jgi:hypothetical protein